MKTFLDHAKPTMGGFAISLALVFGGSTSFAEGLTAVGAGGLETAPLIGGFSADDLQALEHASAADATIARLAAMDVKNGTLASRKSRSHAAGHATTLDAEGDVFRYSSGVLPLLVTRPETVSPIATVGTTPRPGLVQPVGVSAASLEARAIRAAK